MDWYFSKDGNIKLGNSSPIRNKKMTEKSMPFHLMSEYGGSDDFETLEEATAAAKKVAQSRQDDVIISKDIARIKFPIPEYEVEEIA
jgi:hypothetical protein